MRALGNRIRELRAAKGLTQEKLADRSGVHITFIAGIEGGKRNPSYSTLRSLARGFGITLQEMMGGLGPDA